MKFQRNLVGRALGTLWKVLCGIPDSLGIALGFLGLDNANPHMHGLPGPIGWLFSRWSMITKMATVAFLSWAILAIQFSLLIRIGQKVRPTYGAPKIWLRTTILSGLFSFGILFLAFHASSGWRQGLELTLIFMLGTIHLESAPQRLAYRYRVSQQLGHDSAAADFFRLKTTQWSFLFALILMTEGLAYLGGKTDKALVVSTFIVGIIAILAAVSLYQLIFNHFKNKGLYKDYLNAPELKLFPERGQSTGEKRAS